MYFSGAGLVNRNIKVDRFHANLLLKKTQTNDHLVANNKKYTRYFLSEEEIEDNFFVAIKNNRT